MPSVMEPQSPEEVRASRSRWLTRHHPDRWVCVDRCVCECVSLPCVVCECVEAERSTLAERYRLVAGAGLGARGSRCSGAGLGAALSSSAPSLEDAELNPEQGSD